MKKLLSCAIFAICLAVAQVAFGQTEDPVVTNNPSEVTFTPIENAPKVLKWLPPRYVRPGGPRGCVAQVQGTLNGKICLPVSQGDGTPITYSCGLGMSREVGETITVGGSVTMPGGGIAGVFEKGIAVNHKITFPDAGECQTCAGYLCFSDASLQVVKLENRTDEFTIYLPPHGGFQYSKIKATPRCWESRESCCNAGHDTCCDKSTSEEPTGNEEPEGGDEEDENAMSEVFNSITLDLRQLVSQETGLPANWLSNVDSRDLAAFVYVAEAYMDSAFEYAFVVNADGTAVKFDLGELDPFGAIMPFDVDKNGIVDGADYDFVNDLIGTSGNLCVYDFDGDGIVTDFDATMVAANFGDTWDLRMPAFNQPYSLDAPDVDWFSTSLWDQTGTYLGFGDWTDFGTLSVQNGTTVVVPSLCVPVNVDDGTPFEYECEVKFERSVGVTVNVGGSVTVPLGAGGASIGASISKSHSVATAISSDSKCRTCSMQACFKNARVTIDKIQSARRKATVLKFAPPLATAYTSVDYQPKCTDAREYCCNAGRLACCDSEAASDGSDEVIREEGPTTGGEDQVLHIDLRQYIDIDTKEALDWLSALDEEDHDLIESAAIVLSSTVGLASARILNADMTWVEIDLTQNDPFNQTAKLDIDGDGVVTDADVSLVSADLQKTANQSICDVDGDGMVSEEDQQAVTAALGTIYE